MRILLLVIVIFLIVLLLYLKQISTSTEINIPTTPTQTALPTPTQTIPTPTALPTPTQTTIPSTTLMPSPQKYNYIPGTFYNFVYNCSPKICPPVISSDYCPVQTININMPSLNLSYTQNMTINKIYMDILSINTSCLPSGYSFKGKYAFINASDVQYNRGDGIKSTGNLLFIKVNDSRYEAKINTNLNNLPASRYMFTISIDSDIKISFITKNIGVDYTLQNIPVPTQASYPVKIIDGITNIDSLKTIQINNLVKIDKKNIYRFNFNIDGSCTAVCSCPAQMISVQLEDFIIYPGGTKTLKILPFADVRDMVTCITDKTYTPLLFMTWTLSFYDKNGDLAYRAGLGSPTLENFDSNSKYNTESTYPVTPNYKRYANFPTTLDINLSAGTYKVVLTIFSQEKNNSATITNFNIVLTY